MDSPKVTIRRKNKWSRISVAIEAFKALCTSPERVFVENQLVLRLLKKELPNPVPQRKQVINQETVARLSSR